MIRAVRAVAVLAWLGVASAAAQPASPQPDEARQRHEAGKARFKAKDYAGAATEFAAAYELDPLPKYLFNLAQAQRFGDRCSEAIASYRAFLATHPTDARDIEYAETGIARCEPSVPPPPSIACGDGVVAGAEACDDRGTAGGDGCSATCAVEPDWSCAGAPSACTRATVGPPPEHGSDVLGRVLIGAGIGTAAASITLYVMARSAAADTFEVQSRDDFEASRDRASTLQTLSWVAAGATVGLVTTGVIRLVSRSHRRAEVTITPTADGGAVVVGGRF